MLFLLQLHPLERIFNMFAIHNSDHKETDGQTNGQRKILNMP